MNHFPVPLSPKFLEKAEELEIYPEDIEEKFTYGGGHGGQKVNKTENAVFLQYKKLNISVKCHKHREREKNRLSAYKLLITKVENEIKGKESEEAQKIFKIRKQKKRRSRRAKEKMLEEKRRRGVVKRLRKAPSREDIS